MKLEMTLTDVVVIVVGTIIGSITVLGMTVLLAGG